VGLISWVIFGAIVGWIAAKLAGNDSQQGLVLNTVLGIIGALVGGFLWELVQDDDVEFGWDIGSFVIAVLGGVIVSWGYAYLTRKRV
jgi:uncharacterized membrane protein YeaQ/YmgE (transglycosylase-associated protein family)